MEVTPPPPLFSSHLRENIEQETNGIWKPQLGWTANHAKEKAGTRGLSPKKLHQLGEQRIVLKALVLSRISRISRFQLRKLG
jgi:hypothetical protein